MKHEAFWILFMTGAMIATVIGLIIFGANTGNYQILGYFCLASIILFLFIIPAIVIIKDKMYYNKEKEKSVQVIVKPKKALPVYSIKFNVVFITFIAINLIIVLISTKEFATITVISFVLAVLGETIFIIKKRQARVLYLIKDSEKVLKYEANLSNLVVINDIFDYLNPSAMEILDANRGERIVLNNYVNIWSCYTYFKHGAWFNKRNYIFATSTYNNSKDFSIVINNNLLFFLQKENKYNSKYSNVPPFIITGENAEIICQKIEELCSDFFSKLRFKYVLKIQNNKISIGLKHARFGMLNRLINQNKTIAYTNEAIDEISEFLMKLKIILEEDH